MKWLNQLVEKVIDKHGASTAEIVVSSGVSPSGTYHLGTLREVLTAEVIVRELQRRGHSARHIHMVDDMDVFRKVPVGLDESFTDYLGQPLCDVPAPDGSQRSYADYFLNDLVVAAEELNLKMDIKRAHVLYREGYFADAIEQTAERIDDIKSILESVSGHRVDDNWSPFQFIEDGRLKNRRFKAIDPAQKSIEYELPDHTDSTRSARYDNGEVKLNWRVDWPARWWKLVVAVEPFGRDHATKGGSYDTGRVIVKEVFKAEAPEPVPYAFINRTGDTKKMSKSAGDTITAADLLKLLPPEIIWFFIIRSAPSKQLFFDEQASLMKLFDDFAAMLSKTDKTAEETQLLELCLEGIETTTVSSVPFSHLVSSYQAALRDSDKTLELIARTEHKSAVDNQAETIRRELKFIDRWLDRAADSSVKFTIRDSIETAAEFNKNEQEYLRALADRIEAAPADADGEWFHQALYAVKDEFDLQPQLLFKVLYRALIGQPHGPRAGWFMSVLPRQWLVARLRLEK